MAEPMNILGVTDPTADEPAADDTTYWATWPTQELTEKLADLVTAYDLYTKTFGQLWLWRRSYQQYYKNYFRGGRMAKTGDAGQYKLLSINHYRSIVQGLLTLITAQDVAFEPQATNSDYKSQKQCIAAKSVLDYEARYNRLDEKLKNTAEKALAFGEGRIFLDWDQNAGAAIAVGNDGRPVFEGDIKVKTFSPADTIRDFARSNATDDDWLILREVCNKWDLCAIYPEKAEDIRGATIDNDVQIRRFGHSLTEATDDLVCQYTFVHRKTPAVPNGRIVRFITREIPLIDAALPVNDFPVYRCAAADQEETPFGYSPAFDLLPIQEAIDKLVAIIVTNQLTFGVQNIVAPLGTKLSPQQLMDGLNLILTDMRNGVPTVLEMCKTPAEIFQFVEFLVQQMELISGLNSVSRGVAPENLKSGTALAFVQAQALQANSGLQKSYTKLIEDVGTGYLNFLNKYANNRKMRGIVGRAGATYIAEFQSGDTDGVQRVVVDEGNPLTKTTAGRIEVAQNLLQSGFFKTPEEFLSVVETGQLNSLTENPMAELLHIRQENEALRQGMPCKVFWGDNHPLHIKEHMTVINDVDLRFSNDPAVGAASQHIMEHIEAWQTTPPNILAGLGIQPPPMMMPGGPPPQPVQPSPTGPQQAPGAPAGAAAVSSAKNPEPPAQAKAASVRPAKMPAPPAGATPEQKATMQKAEAGMQPQGGQ
jgi:hypothetical protein